LRPRRGHARRPDLAGGVPQGALRAAGRAIRRGLRGDQQFSTWHVPPGRGRPDLRRDRHRPRAGLALAANLPRRPLRARDPTGEHRPGHRAREHLRGPDRPRLVPRQHAPLRRRDAGRRRAQGRHGRSVAPRGAAAARAGARHLSGLGRADLDRRMSSPSAVPAVRSRAVSTAGRLAPALGVGVVWLFLLVFLVYPVLRILYDAFSDEAGRLTFANFVEFARDPYYVRSLANSLLLGLGTVVATSLVGFAVAFLLVRYDFVG